MKKLVEILVRWRTWIVNVVFASPVLIETVMVLIGYNWGTVLPPHVMPYILLSQAVLNVWMRPRPAVISSDIEVKIKEQLENPTFQDLDHYA